MAVIYLFSGSLNQNMSLSRDELLGCVDKLYTFRDLYIDEHPISHAGQKKKDVETKMLETLKLVEDNQSVITNKAEYLMLRGKCLNVKSDYDSQAEELISKAVKLDPKLVEAWNILGECFWKKGDIDAAKNCFSGALQHSKNKVSLRNLSMVLRQFGNSREEKLQHINESVVKAKDAISLDISDGMSWFVLGNAYLSQFFGGTQSEQIIQQCLKAYSQAEKDPIAKNNPDLHFNRSMCFLYQSEFMLALQGFSRAGVLDPAWDIPQAKVEMLRKYLSSVNSMLSTKCGLSGKAKLQKIVSSISDSDLGPYGGGSYTSPLGKSVTLESKLTSDLTEGRNSGVVLLGKVIGCLSPDPSVAYTFIIVDSDQQCIAACLYNVATNYGLKSGDSVAIPEPYMMTVEVPAAPDSGDAELGYKFLRIETPMVLVVNGKKLGIEKQAPTMLKVTAQSE